MTWTYEQSTGHLYHNSEFIEAGYSGSLTNKNNPDRQHVRGMGPFLRNVQNCRALHIKRTPDHYSGADFRRVFWPFGISHSWRKGQ